MSTSFYKKIISIHAVPLPFILLTAGISVGLVATFWLGWAIWQVAILVILAWLPLFFLKTVSIQRQYGWLAFFFILVVTQGAHVLEHVAQMVQIHLLGLSGPQARGILGMLDIEWVHFIWNGWVLLCAVVLVFLFPRNPWLWALLVISVWHEVEHVYIMSVYLQTGHIGAPGLLARGGAIGGGLPLSRPDLHFGYNVLEELVLIIAYLYQIQRLPMAAEIIPSPRSSSITGT